MTDVAKSPIAFEVNVARLPKKGMPVTIDADEEQRESLAAVHDLVTVESFRAEMLVNPWKGDGARVAGRVTARIVQSCVVTLEPVEDEIDESFSALFLPEASKLVLPIGENGEIVLDPQGEDAPEQFTGDSIDVGQLAEEYFALGIDPYPRKPGVTLPRDDADEEENRGPLAEKLQALRNKP
jgi:hypothetical protein